MKPSLILLHGKARSGKGEVAKRLCEEYSYVEVGFADYLKELAIKIFGWNHDEIYTNRTPESRKFMQLLGNEIGRAKDPNFWIKKLEERLSEPFFKGKNIVISDTRYQNEAEWGRSRGGQLWKVIRPKVEELIEANPDHASENDLRDWKHWDCIISNHKTLEDLYKEVDVAISRYEKPEIVNNKTLALLLTDLIDIVCECRRTDVHISGEHLKILAFGLEKLGWKKVGTFPLRRWR